MISGASSSRGCRNQEVRDMSQSRNANRQIGDVQVRPRDPLAALDDEEVLRCRDERTGWWWFYDVVDGRPMRYHEREGFDPPPTSRVVVAETAALDNVDAHAISRVHLEVLRGER